MVSYAWSNNDKLYLVLCWLLRYQYAEFTMSWSWFHRLLFECWLLTSLFIWDHFVIRIKNEWGLVTVYRLDVNPIVQIVFDWYDCILWGFCCDDFDCHIKLNLSVAFKSWLMHIRGQDVIEYAGCFGILFQMTFTCWSVHPIAFVLFCWSWCPW